MMMMIDDNDDDDDDYDDNDDDDDDILFPDVAFKVGGDTGINYLTMQIHYKNVTSFKPPISDSDSSGLTLTSTSQP